MKGMNQKEGMTFFSFETFVFEKFVFVSLSGISVFSEFKTFTKMWNKI